MDSMPPATTTSESPVAIPWAASITDLRPEPQTLLIVRAATSTGSPAPRAACRAGACPRPAETTLPRITSSTWPGSRPARTTASLTTRAPSCGAEKPFSAPRNLPVGTRTAERITASRIFVSNSFAPRRGAATGQVPLRGGQEHGPQLRVQDALRRRRQRRSHRSRGVRTGQRRRAGFVVRGHVPLAEAEPAGAQLSRDAPEPAHDLRLHPVQHPAPAGVGHPDPQRASFESQDLGAARELGADGLGPGAPKQGDPGRLGPEDSFRQTLAR